jgi:hypothetical protein
VLRGRRLDKLQGQKPKFAQITGTIFKIQKCEKIILQFFIFYHVTTTIKELSSLSSTENPINSSMQKIFFSKDKF